MTLPEPAGTEAASLAATPALSRLMRPALVRALAAGLRWDRAALALMAVMTVIMLVVAPDFGITWDEPLHVKNGRLALAWYASLGHDQSVLGFYNLYLYGALYDSVCAAITAISPFDLYATRRVVGGLVALIGVWGCRALAITVARRLDANGQDQNPARAGFLAASLLLLIPDWWGHACNNPKDAPFAVAVIWTLRWLAQAADELPRPRVRTLVALGLCLGATLGIRVGGAILLAPLAVTGLAWVISRLPGLGRNGGAAGLMRDSGGAVLRLLPALLLAYALMVAAWPWAQTAPLTHPLEALSQFSRFPLDFTFPYAGRTMRTLDEPWWYLPVGFGVKLPELILLLLAGAAAMGLRGVGRWIVRPQRHPAWNGSTVTLAAAILVPPVTVVVAHSVLYDGIRHMFFLMLPMAAAAGLVLDHMLCRLARLPRPAIAGGGMVGAGPGLLVFALYAGVQMGVLTDLHPYETIWFNHLTGGVAGAAGKFELDYWGSALSEVSRSLVAAVEARQGPAALTTPYRVRICGPATSALPYLPPAWQQARLTGAPADFYISFTRRLCPDIPPGRDMVRVERDGQTLAFVRDLRPLPAKAAGPVKDTGTVKDTGAVTASGTASPP